VNVIEAAGLGKRYRRTWAVRDCTLAIPPGRVAALVGPNGAGKTTLMHMAVGLTRPTAGSVTVLGGVPAGSLDALNRVAFVAQDAPLYRNLPVADMLHLARNLNRRWDQPAAEARLAALKIPLDRKIGQLSGGQQAQVALTIAMARSPELLILDEPLAALDPLARHEFLASLMEVAAEDGISVLFSSHVISELERVADYLVVLADGHVQVVGDVEELLAAHLLLIGPTAEIGDLTERFAVVHSRRAEAQAQVLVRQPASSGRAGTGAVPPGWQAFPVTLEELVLAYLREPGASALSGPVPLRAGNGGEQIQ
jgi:ABC-2 type transport system ATP-binding protein